MTLLRRLRWALGKGYCAGDFARVYSRAERDAWGYDVGAFAKRRFELIIAAIPSVPIEKALEAGCAEGHLTRHLAKRVGHLVACDICEEAVARARRNCEGIRNVELIVADIRSDPPEGPFNLLVYSDVLYYFSKREVRHVIRLSAGLVVPGGHLVFANEWKSHYRGLTSPTYVMTRLRESRDWAFVRGSRCADDPSAPTLTVGVFRRT